MSGFLAAEESSREIAKTALLARSLAINALITGDRGTGKTTLAREIAPNAEIVSGENEGEISELASRCDSLIIEDFDRVSRPDRLELDGKRIVATSAKAIDRSIVDRFFGITIALAPLASRPLDIPLLAESFLAKARRDLAIDAELDLAAVQLDLSENAHSLRRSIYAALLLNAAGESEIAALMERFLREKLHCAQSVNIYRDYLYLYDKPLILAGLAEYGSQLRLSAALGINRNTLRKKIYELGLEP